MAAGANILHKRKASAFTGAQLAAGELGIHTGDGRPFLSKDGSTISSLADGFFWRKISSTAETDPGSGNWNLNHATLGSVTKLIISATSAAGIGFTTLLPIGFADRILIEDSLDPSKFLLFKVTGVTYSSGFYKLTVTTLAGTTIPSVGSSFFRVFAPADNYVVVLQSLSAQNTTRGNAGTSYIPNDDTLPQSGEGASAGIDVSMTGRVGNYFNVRVSCPVGVPAAQVGGIALFMDSETSCRRSIHAAQFYGTVSIPFYLEYRVAVPDTSAHTFKVRYGSNSGTCYLNGGSANFWGTTCAAVMVVEEILG